MKLFGKSETTVNISTETIAKTILLTIAAFLVIKVLGQVERQLTLFAVAFFLALALNPTVNWLTRRLRSKSRVRATAVAYLLVLTMLIGFLALVVPPFVKQTGDFVRDVPGTIQEFRTQDSPVARTVRRYKLDKQLSQISTDFGSRFGRLSGPVLSTATKVGTALISILTVLVLTFMMLIEGPLWYERILALQPAHKREHRKKMAQKMYRVVTGYVNGQVLIAAIAAAFALVTLVIASALTNSSVNAIALAGIVFVFGLIPLIGNTLAAIIVILFSLFASTTLAIIMAVYFVLYQQIENVTLYPYIQSRSNQLTPMTIFVAALLGAGVGGLLGALAAIPLAGCIALLIEDKLKKDFPDRQDLDKEII